MNIPPVGEVYITASRDTSSFLSIIVISGTAKISVGADSKSAKAGESFFVTAGNKTVAIDGECECVVTRI